MSKQVTELAAAVEKLPGIHNVQHFGADDRTRDVVLFNVEEGNHRGLFVLTRASDRRYWQYGSMWRLELEVADAPTKPLPITFSLSSMGRGEAANLEAAALLESIKEHLRHDAFLAGYSLEDLKGLL